MTKKVSRCKVNTVDSLFNIKELIKQRRDRLLLNERLDEKTEELNINFYTLFVNNPKNLHKIKK